MYIIREAVPRSSTSTERGGRISCCFEFSLLQSRIVSVWVGSVWVCLHTEIQSGWFASSGMRRRTKETQNVYRGGSRRRSASAESHGRINSSTRKDQGVDLHRQRIQESFYIDRRTKETRNISSGGSRRTSASAENQGRLSSSTKKDQGVDLHLQRIKESFFIDRRRKGASGDQQRRIHEKICIGG